MYRRGGTRAMGRDASSMSAISMYWKSVDGVTDAAYACSAGMLRCGTPYLSTVCAQARLLVNHHYRAS